MQLTIGQLLALINARLASASPPNMAVNHAKRKLTQLVTQLGGMNSWGVELPGERVVPSQDFGTRSQKPSEPKEEQSVVADVEATEDKEQNVPTLRQRRK